MIFFILSFIRFEVYRPAIKSSKIRHFLLTMSGILSLAKLRQGRDSTKRFLIFAILDLAILSKKATFAK